MRGALMVCGTASDVGKSSVVAGLCRALHRRNVRVAPFKAQNMSLNSVVTAGGHEIGRAQAMQAAAAGVEAEVAMNPVLLKPSGDTDCQIVVRGRSVGQLSAAAYHARKPELFGTVLDALADLRRRYDVVLLEGAGSPAEINLLDRDIVNLPVAVAAGVKAIVIGDIDRGGVFAALYGTVALLPPDQRACVGGFVINKLRGDPALLFDGTEQLARTSGVPAFGVLPYLSDIALDAEDSLALAGGASRPAVPGPTVLDVAAVRWPRLANATDLDPLAVQPGVGVRWVDHAAALGRPDLLVLPGTKSTIADLAWLRATGLADAIARTDAVVLGICGGYQALGRTISDPDGVETTAGTQVAGLGWLDVHTVFGRDKTLRRRHGTGYGVPVSGYEIHHGRTVAAPSVRPWLVLDGPAGEGAQPSCGPTVFGTNLHGLFEADEFRAAVLTEIARQRGRSFTPQPMSFAAARENQLDRLGDLVEQHLDMPAICRLIQEAPIVRTAQ
ncbi:MAG: cobyric acid synthase [Jatrophihabitans sp.]